MNKKKLITIFACSSLLLGGGTLLAVQSASKSEVRQVRADVEPNANYDHIYSDNDNYNNTEFDTGYNQVLIVYSGTAHGLSGESATITSPETLAMISINDTPLTSLAVIAWEGQFWFRIVYPSTVAAGDVMEVQTGLTIGDAILEGFKLQLNENLKWENNLGTFTFTEVNLDSTATGMYGINLVENEAEGGWETEKFVPVDEDSGVFVDGTRVGTEIKKLNPTTYYIAVPGGVAGTTATVKGKWANSKYSFTVNSFTRTWDGTRWIIESVDVDPISFVGVESGAASNVSFIAGVENAIPNNWADVYKPTSSGAAFLGETDISSSIKCKKPGVKGYFFEGFTASKNDVLTLSGTWTGYSGGRSYTFTINNFSRKWNGEAWDYIDVDAGSVNLLGLSGDGPSNDHQLTLYGTTPNDAPVSWTEGFTIESGDIRKNGMPIDGVGVKKVGPQGYFFEGFTVAQNDIIKIDATITRVEGDYRYHLTIAEYSIQYKGNDTWGFVDVNLGNIEFTRALPDSSASAVYLYTEATNDIPYSPDWLHIYPDGDEQVLFNESDITEGHTIQKAGDNAYYMGLGQDAIFGDLLTIKGAWSIVLGQYEYHFIVPEISLRYSGEAWQTLAEYKESCKDVLDNYLNEDNYLPADWSNALDIIRNGKDNIDVCVDFNDVDSMLDNFKGHLDNVPTRTERAQEAAAEVDALIDAIPNLTRTNYDEDAHLVPEARAAYDALSEDAKGYVSNLNLLQGAESRLAQLDAAIAVDQQIVNIGTVTLEKEQQIINARAAYDALSANENRWVLYLSTLEAAEARLAELKTQKQHAEEVEALINEIGQVETANQATLSKIQAAENAYANLTADEKALVSNYDTLQAARSIFDNKLASDKQAAHDRVEEFMNSINLNKYSKDNQERIGTLATQAESAINAAQANDGLNGIVEQLIEDINAIPQKKAPAKKGCGGSVIATSVVLSALALAGLGLLSIKKRKED